MVASAWRVVGFGFIRRCLCARKVSSCADAVLGCKEIQPYRYCKLLLQSVGTWHNSEKRAPLKLLYKE